MSNIQFRYNNVNTNASAIHRVPMKLFRTIAVFVVILASITWLRAAETAKPNILFIFADDQAPETIGAYGNGLIKTPNLDRLAREGVRFNHAYNQGSFAAAVCVARAWVAWRQNR